MRLTEEEIRKMTITAISELGKDATPQAVKEVVTKTVKKIESSNSHPKETIDSSSQRAILTSFGINTPGVVAAITKSLAESNCDIQDMSQKILDNYFTIIMVVDLSGSPKDLTEIHDDMNQISQELKIKIFLQHEDIFKKMHRV